MVDTLIKKGIIVSMDRKRQVLEHGAIAIEEDRIVAVGNSEQLEREYSSDVEIDAKGKAVLPGLINTHTHLFQNLLKGKRDDLPLVEWVNEVQMPMVKEEFKNSLKGNFENGYNAALLGCIEALKSGTTCIVDNDLRNPKVPIAFKQTGIRGIYALNMADRWVPDEVLLPKEKMVHFVSEICREWHGTENGRITCMYGPSTPFICSLELLQDIRELATKNRMRIQMHVSETKYERDLLKKETGKPPIEFLHSIGFLQSDVCAVHCVWVSDREIEILKKTGVKVSHNPESNMKLGSGVAPVPRMRKEGVTVSLATDGCASNDNLDMFEAMRTAALLHKVISLDASAISSQDVLEMATIEGAKTVGMENEIGSLEPGKKADLILVDLMKSHLRPVHNVVSTLVYCANGADVDTVIVDGKVIVEAGAMKTVDEKEAIHQAERSASD